MSPSFYKPPFSILPLPPWLCLSVCLPLRPRSFPIIPTYCLLSFSSVAPFLPLPSVLPLPALPPSSSSSSPGLYLSFLSLSLFLSVSLACTDGLSNCPPLLCRIWSLELFDMALHCSYLIIQLFFFFFPRPGGSRGTAGPRSGDPAHYSRFEVRRLEVSTRQETETLATCIQF